MVGEFLIFDLVILAFALIINKVAKLGVFKYKRTLAIVSLLGFFVLETIALHGYARAWWDINRDFLLWYTSTISLEDSLLYAILPFAIVVGWEYSRKKWGKNKK